MRFERGVNTLQGLTGRALTFTGGYVHNTPSQTAHDILTDLEGRLDKCTRKGDVLNARCPAHEDNNPSLNVKIGDSGECVILKCWGGCQTEDVVYALGWKMRNLFATDDGWRSHEAREIVDEADAAKQEDAPPLPSDVPEHIQAWIASLQSATGDVDGQLRILSLIADSPEWDALVPALRIAVVDATKGTVRGMASAILGRFDDRMLAWREPPTPPTAEDDTPLTVGLTEWLTTMWQPPDVELAPDAPGLLYRRRIGVVHSNRGVGKSTYGAGSATSASHGGKVLVICCDDTASWASRLKSFGADNVVIGTMDKLAPEGRLERATHDCHAVIIDSWRRWLRAADRKQGGRSNSANDESVVGPVIDRLVDLAHSPRGPAVTMLANEGKSAEATTARGSFALEDAVDFVRRISKEGDVTTITTAFKSRVEIPTGPWRMRLVEPGGFEPTTGGGGSGGSGADPFQPFERLDEQITGYLMTHGDSSARAVTRHVTGRYADVATRLRAVAVRGPDKRWRLNPDVTPVADIGGGEIPGVTDSRSGSRSDSHRTRSHPESPGASDSRSDSQPTPPTRSQWESPTTDIRAHFRVCPPSFSAKVVVVPARRNARMVSMFPSQTPQTTW